LFVEELNIVGFRNLEDNNFKFDKRFNLFYGKNGQGKTSILEAIYFTSSGKSFRTKKLKEMITHTKKKMGSYVVYEDKITSKSLSIKTDQFVKEYKYNLKRVKYDEFIGKLNIISFIPEDIEIIIGTPSFRRSIFDYEISQGNILYFSNLRNLNKLLKLRNKYIKEKNTKDPIFEIYNEEYLKTSAEIIYKRVEYVRNLSILLNLNYRKLFDSKKELKLNYKSELGDLKKLEVSEIYKKLKARAKKVEARELLRGYSLVGPQRDDFVFYLDENEAKSFSSQGEKKSIVFSLKVSHIDMLIKETKETPIFIIDDISSYFDSIRKESILEYFKKRNIQIFISSTTKLELPGKSFEVEKGEIYEKS